MIVLSTAGVVGIWGPIWIILLISLGLFLFYWVVKKAVDNSNSAVETKKELKSIKHELANIREKLGKEDDL